jgi:hypothetical protein
MRLCIRYKQTVGPAILFDAALFGNLYHGQISEEYREKIKKRREIMTFHKNVFTLINIGILCGGIGCGTNMIANEEKDFSNGSGAAIFKIAAGGSSPFSKIANRAELSITASDINPIIRKLSISDSSVEDTVTGIPAGKERLFTLSVYDSHDTLQYLGSAEVDLQRGLTVNVPIALYRAGANAVINGTIVESNVTDLTEKLIAYFPFNGNVKDESFNGNNGKVFGAMLTTDRFGKENSAYQFNGTSDYIEVPYSRMLDCEDSVSIALWAKSDIIGKDGYSSDVMIIQIGAGSEEAYGIGLDPRYNLDDIYFNYRCHWTLPAGHDRATINAQIIDGMVRSGPIPDTAWHYYAFTFDGNTIKGYIDGEWVGSQKALAGSITNMPLRIGAQSKYLEQEHFWDGKIDDIRIYHRVLTLEEIAKIKTLQN